MEHAALISNILNNDILSEAVKDLEERTRAINLISPEWKLNLENNDIFKIHSSGKARYLKGHACAGDKAYVKPLRNEHKLPIIVAGEWALQKSDKEEYSIVARSCESLREIATVMRVSSESELHDGGRFFIRVCDPNACYVCKESHAKYSVPFKPKNWCVRSLRVFDGECIRNEFTVIIQDLMMRLGSFLGILQISIESRTTYSENNYKIGGIINELIIFQKTMLLPSKSLYFKEPVNLPSIEFPEE